jgi:lysophospholipase L1-like esterase
VLVGYPRLLGSTTGCEAFPIGRADLPAARALEESLAKALESAARRAGAAYIDLYELSEGHEICSDDPWVNGRETDQARALAFHPFAEGQQAVADALAEELQP